MARNKIFDTVFFTRLNIRYKNAKNIDKYATSFYCQVIEVVNFVEYRNDHIIGSINIEPLRFYNDYIIYLNKNKKIIIYGNKYKNKQYYRFLKHKGYKVYLAHAQ